MERLPYSAMISSSCLYNNISTKNWLQHMTAKNILSVTLSAVCSKSELFRLILSAMDRKKIIWLAIDKIKVCVCRTELKHVITGREPDSCSVFPFGYVFNLYLNSTNR